MFIASRCNSAQVNRHGQNPEYHDKFRWCDRQRFSQLTYLYEALKPDVKEMITEIAFNGVGIHFSRET